jgi:hypothetical protein
MPYSKPTWRCFRSIDSLSEALLASECCIYSLGTLEIAGEHPGLQSFALVERKHEDTWRWAVCDPNGVVLDHGYEPTRDDAKRVAEDALAQISRLEHA